MASENNDEEMELGRLGPNDPGSDIPVASLVSNSSNSNTSNGQVDPPSRPMSSTVSRPNSTTRTNPLAPPAPPRQNHHFLDDAKAATINRLLQLTGFIAFVNAIIAICLAAIVGVDVIIGVILGGIAAGIAGMFVSCGFQHLRSFQIRTAVVMFFSILAMGCALAEYVAISQVEACAVLTMKGSSAYEYYGQAKYFLDAQTCAATDKSAGSHCNCVSNEQDCFRISFSGDCNSVLNQAPQLAVACVVVSFAQFFFALLALVRLILSTCTCFRTLGRLFKHLVNSMGYEPLPSQGAGENTPNPSLSVPRAAPSTATQSQTTTAVGSGGANALQHSNPSLALSSVSSSMADTSSSTTNDSTTSLVVPHQNDRIVLEV